MPARSLEDQKAREAHYLGVFRLVVPGLPSVGGVGWGELGGGWGGELENTLAGGFSGWIRGGFGRVSGRIRVGLGAGTGWVQAGFGSDSGRLC